MKKEKDNFFNQLVVAVPRLFMAGIISAVISVPLELRLFQNEINYQIAQENAKDTKEEEQKLTERFSDIPKLEEEIKQFQSETAAKEKERKLRYEEFKGEAEGTDGTHKQGKGPVYAEKKAEFDEIDRELTALRDKNNQLIEENRDRIKKLQGEKAQELQKITSAQQNANSFLMEFNTLEKLSEANPAIGKASWLIRALFLMLEISPILVTMMSSSGPYDVILARKQSQVILREKRKIQDLTYTVDREAEENRRLEELIRNSVNEQFNKAISEAAIHPKWQETVDKIANEIATKAQEELLEYVNSFQFVNRNLAKKLDREYSKYQEGMAPAVMENKVVKMKANRVVNRGVRQLKNFIRTLPK